MKILKISASQRKIKKSFPVHQPTTKWEVLHLPSTKSVSFYHINYSAKEGRMYKTNLCFGHVPKAIQNSTKLLVAEVFLFRVSLT